MRFLKKSCIFAAVFLLLHYSVRYKNAKKTNKERCLVRRSFFCVVVKSMLCLNKSITDVAPFLRGLPLIIWLYFTKYGLMVKKRDEKAPKIFNGQKER
jgi:tellurite resistance protein TehA-like permease